MPRRISTTQLRSQIRRAQQKQKQAINKYNAAVRKFNRDWKAAVDQYNREARAHNARVRSNRRRLEAEIKKISTHRTSTRHVTYRSSVSTFQRSFARLQDTAISEGWSESSLFDRSEGEVANSIAVLGALLDASDEAIDARHLQETSIAAELDEIGGDLKDRWFGALFALNPANPDAARHFCVSSREILTQIIDNQAPDQAVLTAEPDADLTPDGYVSRRAKLRFCLQKRGLGTTELEEFVAEDIDNVLTLFREVNDGAHGSAGRFTLSQLLAIKRRVEDAIRFLHSLVG